jgi:hypothetical protein
MNRNVRNYILGGLAAATLVAVAACGGGGSPGVPYPSIPGAGATSLPSGQSATITMPQTTGLGVGTVQVKGSGSLSASQSTTAANSVPALQLKTRSENTRDSTGNTTVAYVTLTATAAATISQVIISVSPSSVPSGTYYLAYWNGTQWVTVGSPATVSGNLITVNSGTITPAISLAAGASLYLAVYTGQILTTPSPPPPAPVAVPTSLTLFPGQTKPVTVTSGEGIEITGSASPSGVATVTCASNSSSSACSTGTGTTVTFNISAVGAGTTTITFTDPLGHTATTTVTVNTSPPTPSPVPGSAVIGLGDIVAVNFSAYANTAVTIAVSPSPSSVAAVNTSNSATGASGSITVTTNSTGAGTFYIVGEAGGTTTIDLTDTYGNEYQMPITVSAVTNGAFTNGLTGWTPCSYQHTALAAPVDPASPLPNAPEPAQTSAATTPVPLASISPLVTIPGAPPANDNPGYPSAGSITQSGITYTSPGSAPSVLGSDVALVGTIEASVVAYPKGAFGMCQTITVPASTPYLSFWVLEGGSDYSFATGDQEAAIFGSYGTNVASSLDEYLFAEMDCYLHPTTASPAGIWGGAGVNTTSGCWPSAYGGDTDSYYNWIGGGFWSQRGPYNLSAYAGTSVTLFIGNWSYYHDSAAYYAQFLYVGNVQLGATNTFPNNAIYTKGRSLGAITLKPRAAIQSTKPRP